MLRGANGLLNTPPKSHLAVRLRYAVPYVPWSSHFTNRGHLGPNHTRRSLVRHGQAIDDVQLWYCRLARLAPQPDSAEPASWLHAGEVRGACGCSGGVGLLLAAPAIIRLVIMVHSSRRVPRDLFARLVPRPKPSISSYQLVEQSMADTKIASIEDDAEFNTAEHRTGGDVLFADDPEMDGLSLYEKKALLVNRELDSHGMGRYQWCIFFLCGFGYLIDLMYAQVGCLESFPSYNASRNKC